MIDVCIGYDEREAVTYATCVKSIRRHTTSGVRFFRLSSEVASTVGLQREDSSAATAFSLSRFLVPWLPGIGRSALFCDCDFLFTQDLQQLFDCSDPKYAVQVVKHPESLWIRAHGDLNATVKKMDGKINSYYPRKWWSALVLWNLKHPANRRLTLYDVKTKPASWLHRFQWLQDEEIGDLPEQWHWLDGYSADTRNPPAGIHFTRGTPELGWDDTRWAGLWHNYQEYIPVKRTRA